MVQVHFGQGLRADDDQTLFPVLELRRAHGNAEYLKIYLGRDRPRSAIDRLASELAFDLAQHWNLQASSKCTMPAILYTCPITRERVSGWIADDPESPADRLEPIECIACRRTHLINPGTGKISGAAHK